MSDTGEQELKAGHPPAVKVGQVRVSRSRGNSGSERITSAELAKQQEEFGTVTPAKPNAMVVSGAPTKEQNAFPEEAVRNYHEKPQPTHQKPHTQAQHRIQQPRK